MCVDVYRQDLCRREIEGGMYMYIYIYIYMCVCVKCKWGIERYYIVPVICIRIVSQAT